MALERQTGNFAVAYDKAKGRIATARQYMQERIKQGVGSNVCDEGAWTSENFNVVDRNIYGCLAEFNPLIPYRAQAVQAMSAGEFYLTDEVLLQGKPAAEVLKEISEQDSTKPDYRKRVINLGQSQTHNVPTDSLADDKGIVFLARSKKLPRDYGMFLKNKAGIPEIIFYLPLIQPQDYARGFWLVRLGLGNRSGFDGSWGLYFDGGSVFRVRGKSSAEGAQKISPQETEAMDYTSEDLRLAILAQRELEGLAKILQPELYQNIQALVSRIRQ